jgi:acetyltransferase-like isoleucine patch superfamily enzyme
VTAGAIIGGSSIILPQAYIGLGAVIRNKVIVGAGATIGMGAVVVENVPGDETWVGNPARKLK